MEKIGILTTPVSFDKGDYLSLLSLAVGAAVSRQKKMGELVIGENGWNVDVKNRRIKFGESEFDCGIIGSESYQSNTWLWGWANTESGVPEICFAPSRRAKRNLPECEEFLTGKFMLDEIHTGHNLSMITVAASEKNACYYRCPYDGGALFVQIEGLPESVFAPISLDELAREFLEIIRSFYCDHKLLAASFLHQNGYSFEDGGDFISAAGGMRTIRFDFEEIDGIFRVVNISLQ